MPMPCWARDGALIAALAICACAPAPADSAADQAAQTTSATLTLDGAAIPVTLDRADIDPAGDHETTLIERRGKLTLITDSYASREQGLSRCQAGREVYFRAIDQAAKRELYAKLIESCLKDVVSGDPSFTWTSPDRITLNLLSEPSITLAIGAEGTVAPAQ